MSNNGSLSVNYKIDGNNITFKDVEVFSSRPIDFSHPLALGTSRMASIRLKENNINDDNDKELGIAKKFLQGKQLSSNFDFTKDGLPVAEASVVDESIQEAEAVSDEDEDEDEDEDGKLQFKNEGTIAEGGPQYPEGEAGTEVVEEPQPQQQSNSLLGNIGSAIGNVASTTGNALGSAVSTTGNALGSAVSTTGNAIESVASTTGDALGITKNNQAASPATTGESLNQRPNSEVSLAPMGIQNRPSSEPAAAAADSDNTSPSVTEQIKKQSALERLRSQKTDYAAPKTFWSKFGGKRTKRNLGKMTRNKQTKKGGKQNRTKRNNKGKRKTVKQ